MSLSINTRALIKSYMQAEGHFDIGAIRLSPNKGMAKTQTLRALRAKVKTNVVEIIDEVLVEQIQDRFKYGMDWTGARLFTRKENKFENFFEAQ